MGPQDALTRAVERQGAQEPDTPDPRRQPDGGRLVVIGRVGLADEERRQTPGFEPCEDREELRFVRDGQDDGVGAVGDGAAEG